MLVKGAIECDASPLVTKTLGRERKRQLSKRIESTRMPARIEEMPVFWMPKTQESSTSACQERVYAEERRRSALDAMEWD